MATLRAFPIIVAGWLESIIKLLSREILLLARTGIENQNRDRANIERLRINFVNLVFIFLLNYFVKSLSPAADRAFDYLIVPLIFLIPHMIPLIIKTRTITALNTPRI